VDVVAVELVVLDDVEDDADEDVEDDCVLDVIEEELLFTCVVNADDIAGVVDEVCELVVEIAGGVELRARYAPTATTMTTTTTTAMTPLPIALRPP
jgi:hypothetical protein